MSHRSNNDSATNRLCWVSALLMSVAGAAVMSSTARGDLFFCCGSTNSNNAMKWGNNIQTWKFLTGITGPRPSIENVARKWTDIPQCGMVVSTASDDDNQRTSSGDGNEIAWMNNAPNDGTLAVADVHFTFCSSCISTITEADIMIFGRDSHGNIRNWTGTPTPIDATRILPPASIPVVMSHEFGHAIGLAHSADGLCRMENDYPAGGWFHDSTAEANRVTPLGRDVLECKFLYPANSSSFVDMAVLNMQHINLSAEPTHSSWTLSDTLSGNVFTPDFFPANTVSRNGSIQNALGVTLKLT